MSSASVNSSFCLSSSLKEEAMVSQKQGIVSILERAVPSASLRRTLSADMSSKKWQSQHGLCPLKKIASSGEFPVCISDPSLDVDEECESGGEFEILAQKEKENKEIERPGQFDIWASILSQKAQEDSKTLAPPYVHPLVRRSASSLSEKSLGICTESLGSETGSDGFSSYPPSESGDAEEDKEEEQEEEDQEEKVSSKYDMEDWSVAKYNLAACKKSTSKSFPPPLPSLSRRDGASLHMRPRRDNGRLVLEAVSVPSQNNFRAQRHDGRLVLTFVNNPKGRAKGGVDKGAGVGLFEVEIDNLENEKEHEDYDVETETEEEEMEVEEREEVYGGEQNGKGRLVVEQESKFSSGMINVHRLALMMHKPMVLPNRKPTWPSKFNEIVHYEEQGVNPVTPVTQSLPPRPPMSRMIPMPSPVAKATAAASSFNAYEYYWKPKQPTVAAGVAAAAKSSVTKSENFNSKYIVSKNVMTNEKQELVVLRGNNGDYLVPLSKGCKEPKRSLFFWEPYCIATT